MLPSHTHTPTTIAHPPPRFLRALWAPAWLWRYRGAWLLGLALLLSACGGGGGGGGGGASGGGASGERSLVGAYVNRALGHYYVIANDAWIVYPQGRNTQGPIGTGDVYKILSKDDATKNVITEITFTSPPSAGNGFFPCPSGTTSGGAVFPPTTCYIPIQWAFDNNGDLNLCIYHQSGYPFETHPDLQVPLTYTLAPSAPGNPNRPQGCGGTGNPPRGFWELLTPVQ